MLRKDLLALEVVVDPNPFAEAILTAERLGESIPELASASWSAAGSEKSGVVG